MWSQPYLIDQMNRQHQKELLANAEKARSVREALAHRESRGWRWSLLMLLQRFRPVRRGTGAAATVRKTLATVPDGLANAGESPTAGAIAALCSEVGGDSKLPQCS
jgi:hypothetical protein